MHLSLMLSLGGSGSLDHNFLMYDVKQPSVDLWGMKTVTGIMEKLGVHGLIIVNIG